MNLTSVRLSVHLSGHRLNLKKVNYLDIVHLIRKILFISYGEALQGTQWNLPLAGKTEILERAFAEAEEKTNQRKELPSAFASILSFYKQQLQ